MFIFTSIVHLNLCISFITKISLVLPPEFKCIPENNNSPHFAILEDSYSINIKCKLKSLNTGTKLVAKSD